MSKSILSAFAVLLMALLAGCAGRRGTSLVSNNSLEELDANGRPAGWNTVKFWGPPPQFASDDTVAHTGQRSLRIAATQSTQAFLRSGQVPVVPGEWLHASAWVKIRDVPAEAGKVIMSAEFANADGHGEQFGKYADALIPKSATQKASDWQWLEGVVKVPPMAATTRLRLGMFNSTGTIWWDDVQFYASSPLALHIDLKSGRLEPEMEGIAVMIVNRAGEQGPAMLLTTLGKERVKTPIQLTGNPTQREIIPMQIAQRGELPLEVVLLRENGEQPIYADNRGVEVPPPLVLYPPIPTHWAKEDGAAKIEGETDVAALPGQRDGATLRVTLMDKAAHPIVSWSSDAARPVANGMSHFQLAAPDLPEGDYTLVAEFRSPGLDKPIRAEQPWSIIPRRLARTVLNKDGYLEYDGKPIFPLGIFNGGGKMAETGKAGFTVTHSYNDVNVERGERPPDQRAKNFLDHTQQNGMKMLLLIPRDWVFHRDWELFRRRVRMFRNHPALLAWDEEEGVARGDMKMADLAKMEQIIREEDPNHPIMVGDSRDQILKVTDRSDFFPLAHMDLGMWWWYPIPPGGGKADALQGEEKTKALELTPPSFQTLYKGDKPLWIGVQSYRKDEKSRYPNPIEYRAQAYIAIIHGAKGLMWYAGSVEGGLYLALEEGHWDYLQKLARELRELSPVFMSPTASPPTFSPADAPISVMLKHAAGRDLLLTANRGSKPIDITFDLPTGRAATTQPSPIRVLYEDRTIPASDHPRDHFEPYAVHVYELPTGAL